MGEPRPSEEYQTLNSLKLSKKLEAPGAPQCMYTSSMTSLQEMGIRDDFHQNSILVCIDELCGQNTENVSKNSSTQVQSN